MKFLEFPQLSYIYERLMSYKRLKIMYQMGQRTINHLSAHSDKILIAKLVDMETVGYYNLAWQLIIFPLSKINPVVNKVAFPVYARLQEDVGALNNYYSLNVKILSLVTVPFLIYLMFFSYEVVVLIYGEGWAVTASILPALALLGMFKVLGNPGGAIMLAIGKVEVGFWWTLLWTVVVLAALSIGLKHSPNIYTAVYILLGLSLTLGMVWHFLVYKYASINYLPIAIHLLRTFIVVAITAFCSYMAVNIFGVDDMVLRVVVSLSLCLPAYIAYIIVSEKGLLIKLRSK